MSQILDRFRQNTLSRDVAISGIGIHTGKRIQLRLLPAPQDTGIVLRRVDCGGIEIRALTSEVCSVDLATTLGRDDVTISTVEHLLAALRLCDVDNVYVELDGPEVPILDGSALPFIRLIEATGLQRQDASRRVFVVTAPLSVDLGGKSIRVSPYPGLRVSYSIDFANAAIGHQQIDLEVTRQSFERELASARTFALDSDVAQLRQRGLGLGGHQDNCVIFDADGPANTALRFADEPVRHKALDAIGDLALLGAPLWAHVEVERGGHQVHYSMAEALRSRPDCWTWAIGEPRPRPQPGRDPRRKPIQSPGERAQASLPA
jgi:UDP-3-O-[3-hydroxymyristoyl] N-acetylglucosamine deacetylase